MAAGEPWRLITGQLVHWTARMALVDLGMLALLGVWVERRSRPLLAATLATAAVLAAGGLQLFAREVELYRGSSGLATALFAVVALGLLCDGSRGRIRRSLGAVALLLLAAKTAWEATGGTALAAGTLPEGVAVTPVVHLVGGAVGLASYAAWSLSGHRPRGPA